MMNCVSCYLSLSIVHSSPPKQASISMYRYLLSLNVRYNLNTNNLSEPATETERKKERTL